VPTTFSLVLPAYNEALRLPRYLPAVRKHLADCYGDQYEVLVVDDGSTDGLPAILDSLSADWPQLHTIRHAENRGKGMAVRSGVLAAGGELILFADADGATPIEEQSHLAAAIRAGADVAIGSRLIARDQANCDRNWLRGAAGRAFAALARQMLRLPIRDTQCGFKMFRGAVARQLFEPLHESGFLFDLEVLACAGRRGYKIVELPIHWTEMPGGHFSLAGQIPHVLAGLWRLRRRLAEK
jgi:dolichyl-phosphate beta-glucosyltransferase